MKPRITNYLLGLVGFTALLVCCALLPLISTWATHYAPVLVYTAFFLIMMLVGAFLNKGVTQLSHDWTDWRHTKSTIPADTTDD
ncbi:hypothetical protein [Lawsonella clevelandensis]|uniref:Uncharacterized protein n=1 Tax=Lawsonella clevelandensis TaxID=1528099 RepID=A0A0M4LZ44_9ACTN|nr:hypothetical protein [Lawsonella clevelandensis]ALE18919.1 hypothetical protein AL705_03820 [Lawsonella clevelandensis]ALE34596.1 hypothetical protein IY73_03755 [Lawsonella clevelandensis]MDU7194161.1 hypothetical protein [Lawsonella clevelandensis]